MSKDCCALCEDIPTVEIVCALDSSWTCAAHEAEVIDICLKEGVHILEIQDRVVTRSRYRR